MLCFVIDHVTLSLQSYILAGNCTEEVWMSERAAMAFLTFLMGLKNLKYNRAFALENSSKNEGNFARLLKMSWQLH